MGVRFPVSERLGLGVGLDLPWGQPIGFAHDPVRGDGVAPRVLRFLHDHAADFSYLFVSFQPRNRNLLDAGDYLPIWEALFAELPDYPVRALHQTTLNLGAADPYERGRIFDLTNALIARFGLRWVNEDLGLWSLGGKPLPYPLPPYLTAAGLAAAIANVATCQRHLRAPLLVEFPGFSEGVSLTIGPFHAYDFFRQVVEETDSPATLDVGHLLSWQWLRGRRGAALFDELERLPLRHCFEIHLSGCHLAAGRFIDAHDGVLMGEQLDLLERLLPLCPNLAAVTYEDPRFDEEGALVPAARPGFARLKEIISRWAMA